jgi:hypothetical protein
MPAKTGDAARALSGAALAIALLAAPVALRSEGAAGVVKVTSDPAGADIWIDDIPRGATPALIEVDPGRHALRLEHPGYRPVIRYIEVVAGRLHKQHVALDPEAGGPAASRPPRQKVARLMPSAKVQRLEDSDADAAPGTVTIATTPPGLRVFMNDELIPQPTPVIFDIRPGIYELRIEDQGETVFRRTIFVRPNAVSDLDLLIRKARRIDYSDPWQ